MASAMKKNTETKKTSSKKSLKAANTVNDEKEVEAAAKSEAKTVKSSEKTASLAEKKTATTTNTEKKATKSAKEKVVVQYLGNEVDTEILVEQAKSEYLATGGDEKAIKELKLYLKPEENAAYYVVNGIPAGKIALFV